MTFRAICTAAVSLAFLGCASEAVAQPKSDAPKQVKPEAAKPAPAKPAKDVSKADIAKFVARYKADLCVDAGKCEVNITVGEGCTFQFDPYVLGIHKTLKDVEIRWNITKASAGKVEFPKKKGIFWKSQTSTQNSELEDPQYAGPTQYKAKDKNSSFSDNPYGVNVIQNDKACPTYDPSIINGAS